MSWHFPQSNTHPLLAPLSQNDHNATLPLPSRASHPLHQADGVLLRVEADDEVHLTDVQTLFTNAGRHQRVEAALAKPVHDLPNKKCSINAWDKNTTISGTSIRRRTHREHFGKDRPNWKETGKQIKFAASGYSNHSWIEVTKNIH